MPDPRRVEPGRPLAARDGGEARLGVGSGQFAAQPLLEPRDGVRERHGTSVIAEQLLCGAGYDRRVIARTTSAAMNAYPASFGCSPSDE